MKNILFIIPLFFVQLYSFSACLPTPISPFPFINATTTSAVFGSVTVTTTSGGAMPNADGNYVFSGTSYTISSGDVNNNISLYVKSGQNLTMNYAYNVNGGKLMNIYVEAGGTFTYTGNSFKGGRLYTWGNIVVPNTASLLAVTGLYVGPAGLFSAPGQSITVPSTGGQFLVDGGLIDVGTLNINSNSNTELMCFKNNGCLKVSGDIFNDADGPFAAPDNTGYFYWSKTAPSQTGNQNLISTTLPVNTTTNLSSTAGSNGTQAKFCSTTDVQLNGGGVANATCLAKITFNSTVAPNASCINPLPIVLIFFETSITSEGIRSSWAITKQWDSDYFIIEKSKNGIDWEIVNTVESIVQSNKYQEYSLTDYNPYGGDSYYRLVEVDTKGNKTVYAIDFVRNDNDFRGFAIYPNPSNGDFIVSISGDFPRYDLSILDVTGRNLGTYVLSSGKNEIGTILPTGIYMAKLKIGYNYYTQKIIIQ